MSREALAKILPERRKEKRLDAHLKGRLRFAARTFAMEIGDLSRSGALVLVKDPPPPGALAELWIEDYGPIAIQVMHSGVYFCGVAFDEAATHCSRLLGWLGEDTIPVAAGAA